MLASQASSLPESDDPSEFRVVHYLGSKLRLIGAIRAAIGQAVPVGARVCDLFSGSGAVSLGLRHSWSVTAADIQEYSRVLCSALLNPPMNLSKERARITEALRGSTLRARLRQALQPAITYERATLSAAASGSMDALCDLVENGSLILASQTTQGAKASSQLAAIKHEALASLESEGLAAGESTVVTRYFGGVYFSWEQAIELDVLLEAAHQSEPRLRDHFLGAVLSVASDIVNTVGKQFAQPIRPRDTRGRPKLHLVRQTLRDRNMNVGDLYQTWLDRFASVPAPAYRHRAMRGDFREVLGEHGSEFDIVYADPPYTRDHYSRYYHVLETMALRDEPLVSTTTIRTGGKPVLSRGLYRKERHQSPFCIKNQAPSAFDALCRTVAQHGKPLLLSYSPYKADAGNRPRLLGIRELTGIARRYFDFVSVVDVDGVFHNKFNLTERNITVDYAAEILMLCRPWAK